MRTDLIDRVEKKQRELARLRPIQPELLTRLQRHFDVELTYTSNAIEGNTLTLRETAEVIEHGLTVGGKKLRDHLEAVDHYEAIQWIRELAATSTILGETTVTELHRRIVARSQPQIAGFYSPYPRRIAGSPVIFPNPLKVSQLMEALGARLSTLDPTPESAFDMHYALTSIHPFSDGNGRTARLLMNLLLMRGGYPPMAVRPEDRPTYLNALERASLADDLEPFQNFMHQRLEQTLDEYLALFAETAER